MSRIKIAATILILGAGLAGSYFIVKNSSPIVKTNGLAGAEKTKEAINNSTSQSPVKWIESLTSSTYLGVENATNTQNELNSLPPANLTKFVSQLMFSRMKKLDQSDKNPFENFDPNDPQNQKLIQEAMAALQDQPLLDITINESELKISDDNSIAAKSRYLNNLADLIVKDDPLKKLSGVINSFNFSEFNKIADGYQRLVDGFINTPVPFDWLEHHKRFIIILKKEEMIYRNIADYQKDPIKAGLFAQAAAEVANEESVIRKEFFEDYLGLR